MGSDSAFGEEFYNDVPYNEDGKIELPIGTRVKLKGKHCIVVSGEPCYNCILHVDGLLTGLCTRVACTPEERADCRYAQFEEIVHD